MIDFAIVGQAKSGTTALAEFLARHPRICMSIPKEPAYFATDLMEESDAFHGGRKYFEFRTETEYEATFAHCLPAQLRGEASTGYLHSRVAASNIHAANPAAKIVVMLREPVSFMRSLHVQYLNETTEDETDFAEALAKEVRRKRGECVPARVRCPSYLFYRERAQYTSQLERYYTVFGHENVLTFAMEEFRDDNERWYRNVLAFLGVEPEETPAFSPVHASKAPRSRRLNQALNNPALKSGLFKMLGPRRYTALSKGLARTLMKQQRAPELSPGLEKELHEEFASEVERVSDLVGRDFSEIWGYEGSVSEAG